jgi:hypothetical protein
VRAQGPLVGRTVADLWRSTLGLDISIVEETTSPPSGGPGTLVVDGGREGDGDPLCAFVMRADGGGELRASHPRWLYGFAVTLLERLPRLTMKACGKGIEWRPTFPWMRNISDHLVGSLRLARHFSPDEYCRQIAEQGSPMSRSTDSACPAV